MNTTGQKFGGRKVGSKNLIQSETKIWVKKLVEGNQKQFEKDLKALKPFERISVLERMLQYCIPKMQAIDASVEFQKLTTEDVDRIATDLLKSIETEV